MFSRSAVFYDAIYDAVGKDYESEAAAVLERIEAVAGRAPTTLLDVACGTGRHLEFFAATARCAGLDVEPELLAVARRRCPGVRFVEGDMTDFDLAERFDTVTCLFSSIGYVRTLPALRRAVTCMAAHLGDDGVLVVEPWFGPEQWQPGRVDVVEADVEGDRIVRMMRAAGRGTSRCSMPTTSWGDPRASLTSRSGTSSGSSTSRTTPMP
jgi:SAM-dependent methyltransferase